MNVLLRVLIVEDSEDDALLLLRELRRGGYRPLVERVETFLAMSDALDRETWNIILADYSLPHLSAEAALQLMLSKGIALAQNLGMDAIAEGVETGEQLALLRSLGCEYGQGYLFSKPMDAESARALLASKPKW